MAGLPPAPGDNATIGGDKEGSDETTTDVGAAGNSQDSSGGLECPICLQPCMHPVELPCHHVFCFLCIKGVAIQGPNSRCAICRAQIPYSVLTNPHLKDVSQLTKEPKLANGYQWYYESRGGGWWQYDERTMQELEKAFSTKLPTCQLLLAGHIYIVDFTQMIQYRSNNRNVSRRIKRGINLEKRGVAGIRIAGNNSGDGSNGGTNNGSPPPPPSGSSGRRRRGNISAPVNAQTTNAPGNLQASGVSSRSPVLPNPNHQNAGNPPGASSRENDGLASDSDDESVDEDEDYDSDYSEDVDADDDMELGEEEEALIGDDSEDTEDDDEYDTRDGARAPTRRSDRSNSSNNQTPPPPSGAGPTNGSSSRTYSPNSNGRGSRGAKSGRNSGGGRASNGSSGATSRTAPMDHFATAPSSYPASPNVLVPLFFNRCNLEDVARVSNNNNIYIDSQIIGQVSCGVSQNLSSIATAQTGVKITVESRSQLNQDEFL